MAKPPLKTRSKTTRSKRRGKSRSTPWNIRLIEACLHGDLKQALDALTRGADINARNSSGETPLSSAAIWNHANIVRFLLKRQANPNVPDKLGATPLLWAAQHADLRIIKALLRAGARADATDRYGNSALMHALWRQSPSPSVVRELLKHDIDVHAQNDQGESAFAIASQRRLTAIERLLRAYNGNTSRPPASSNNSRPRLRRAS